ncbi:hypothetical protein [Mycetocola sp. JXN-3]|uniref:hypothetical protein n=1 Tax=Mycetocola sp. JXN-3 TaxID=2116510 RepID=UPI00165CFB15|nr:hypothetical protein [Mycetocola sp. JXN-3]
MKTTATRQTRRLAALAFIPLSIALLAGCSAGGGTSPSPEAGTDSEVADQGSGGGTSQQEYDSWVLKFNACMEKKGHDMPEPGKPMKAMEPGAEADAFMADQDACQKEVGPIPGAKDISEKDVAESSLKFSQCLRDNGIDVPDSDRPGAITLPMGADKEIVDKCTKEADLGGIRG